MRILIVATISVMPGFAIAASCDGSSDVLTVENWNIAKVEGPLSGIDITLSVKSHAKQAFRMIDGNYTFEDVLGRRISGFQINPDLTAKPGEIVSTTTGYMGTEMDRVPKMDRSDVVVTTCTNAIVYSDGTKEQF